MNGELQSKAQLIREHVGDEVYEYYPLGKYVVRARRWLWRADDV